MQPLYYEEMATTVMCHRRVFVCNFCFKQILLLPPPPPCAAARHAPPPPAAAAAAPPARRPYRAPP